MEEKSVTQSNEAKRAHTDKMIAQALQDRQRREQGYRERALKIYPWICGRCAREFTRENLQQLTVHHRDHNHDNNPSDGSNWELLCLYCHDNEHSRERDAQAQEASGISLNTSQKRASSQPFANLKELLGKRQE